MDLMKFEKHVSAPDEKSSHGWADAKTSLSLKLYNIHYTYI